MASQAVEFVGFAARPGPTWADAKTGRMFRYAPNAFELFLATGAALCIPIRVEHSPNWALPQARLTGVDASKMGLWFKLEITADDAFSRRAVLAVRHGFLGGVSLGLNSLKLARNSDGVELIRSTMPRELSLTTSPACPGCAIFEVGVKRTAAKTLPRSPIELACLTLFLRKIGCAAPVASKPFKSPPARSKQAAHSSATSRVLVHA